MFLPILVALASNAFAATVTDTLTVPTGDSLNSNYSVDYKATLAADGLVSDVRSSVVNRELGPKRISPFFKGPGTLKAAISNVSNV